MSVDAVAEVNYRNIIGAINPRQHGSNSSPVLSIRGLLNFDREYKAMHFWGARTHDWPLWNSGQRMIDTHFIFPLLKLDPADPSNYYFKATDAIIEDCQNTGAKNDNKSAAFLVSFER